MARYIESDILALAGAGRNFNFGDRRGIWVDCIKCGRRDRLDGNDTEQITDEAAQRIFENHGWSVGPTLCPDHKEAVAGTPPAG